MTNEERKERKRAKDRARHAANKEKLNAKNRAYHAAKREEILARSRARYAEKKAHDLDRNRLRRRANPEVGRAYGIAYRAANPEKCKQSARASRLKHWDKFQQWVEQNREKLVRQAAARARANPASKRRANAKRRALKTRAMPCWVDHDAIDALYRLADALTRDTGIKHEVDHIVPLSNPLVCGLHVACNLRVVTQRENRSKNNKLIAA
jgi:hypothetical protein